MTIKITRIGLIGIFLAMLSSFSHAQTNIPVLFQDELLNIAEEIELVREQIEEVNEPSVRQLAKLRLEVLLLSQAILQNRVLILSGSDVAELRVPTTEPNMRLVADIVADMKSVEEVIANAEENLKTADGIDKAIINTRIESEKLALAQLRIAYISARYGSAASYSIEENIDQRQGITKEDNLINNHIDSPFWADQRHPEIDYKNPQFKIAYESGAKISGWWTILGEGDSSAFVAQNLSTYFPNATLNKRGMLLQIRCSEEGDYEVSARWPGEYLAGYNLDAGGSAYDVAYRVDGGVLVRNEWHTTIVSDGAILGGAAAADLVEDLYAAQSLMLVISGTNPNRLQEEFDLSGFDEVEAIATKTCTNPPIELARRDYQLVQSLLNIAGFDAGPVDGIWGSKSQRAMQNYQVAAGISATGKIDRPSLRLLGLLE